MLPITYTEKLCKLFCCWNTKKINIINKSDIPASWRLQYKIATRTIRDALQKQSFASAKNSTKETHFPFYTEIQQPIFPSYLFENKIHNLKLAAKRIEQITILPEQVFSFWRSIGHPNAKNGFKIGRNIIGGKLQEDYGGGLCQISGIIYHTALTAGLHIAERHNHSIDIYTEEKRYSPLGADATVVYGYKDLRIKNTHSLPLRFTFDVLPNALTCRLLSTTPIPIYTITFSRQKTTKHTKVITKQTDKNGNVKIVGESLYVKWQLPVYGLYLLRK